MNGCHIQHTIPPALPPRHTRCGACGAFEGRSQLFNRLGDPIRPGGDAAMVGHSLQVVAGVAHGNAYASPADHFQGVPDPKAAADGKAHRQFRVMAIHLRAKLKRIPGQADVAENLKHLFRSAVDAAIGVILQHEAVSIFSGQIHHAPRLFQGKALRINPASSGTALADGMGCPSPPGQRRPLSSAPLRSGGAARFSALQAAQTGTGHLPRSLSALFALSHRRQHSIWYHSFRQAAWASGIVTCRNRTAAPGRSWAAAGRSAAITWAIFA